jgi:hypothetical protein
MRRAELENLLPRSVVSSRSPSDVLQALVVTSIGGGTAAGATGSSGSSASAVSSALQGTFKDVKDQLSSLTSQIGGLVSVQQAQTSAMQDNTQALGQNTTTRGSGSSIGGTVEGIASSILGGGLSPIISSLLSLFGGSSTPSGSVQTPFLLPPPVDYRAGLTGTGQVTAVDSGQNGQVRTQSASVAPQVTVQVNAMDSKSFLDHSDDIANAVKSALLNSHSLSDVIGDL